MVRPAISRGTGLPGSVRPFTVTEASWHPTKRLGMWCFPVADLSGGKAKQKGAEATPCQPHIEVAGSHRLAVVAGRIARSFNGVEPPVDQALKTCQSLVG